MTPSKSNPTGVSRRRFIQSTSLATAAWSSTPRAMMAATTRKGNTPGAASQELCLWYDRPAETWMTEALPIGNGPMGAMLFGGTAIERIQFNEISLWSGDRMPRAEDRDQGRIGAHQAIGDIFIRLGHDPAEIRDYRRQLDIGRAVHTVEHD